MLVIALAIGALTRLWQLTSSSVYVDEAHTFAVAAEPWHNMLATLIYHDYHPPLFYAVTHVLLAFGWAPAALRFATAPLALVTTAAAWGIGRRLFGPIAGGIAAILVAVDPSAILWDRIYRMYVVLDALVALSWWLILAAQDSRGMRRTLLWIAFAICAIAQPYVHYLGGLDVACQAVYALTRVRAAWPVLAGAALSVLGFVPWIPAVRIQYPGGGLVAGTAALPVEWWTLARDAVLAGTPLAWIQAAGFDVAVTLAVVGICVWAAFAARSSILPFWLLLPLAQVILSVVTGKFVAVPRYLLPALPVLAIGIGALVQLLLLSHLRAAGLVLCACALALFGFCATNVLFDPRYQFPDWNIVRSIFSQGAQPGDIVVFDQGYSAEVFANDPTFVRHEIAAPGSVADIPSTLAWLQARPGRRVWYVENQYYYVDPARAIAGALENARPQVGQWLEPRVELSDRVYVALFGPERWAHASSR